jgi:hypothetical protein
MATLAFVVLNLWVAGLLLQSYVRHCLKHNASWIEATSIFSLVAEILLADICIDFIFDISATVRTEHQTMC